MLPTCYSMILTETDNESICKALQSDDTINGISSKTISAPDTDIMALKAYLKERDIETGHPGTSCEDSPIQIKIPMACSSVPTQITKPMTC